MLNTSIKECRCLSHLMVLHMYMIHNMKEGMGTDLDHNLF